MFTGPQSWVSQGKKSAVAGGGGNAFTLIAHAIAHANDDPATGAIDTTGANLLVVAVSQYQGSGNGTLSDSKSNTWTPLTQKESTDEAHTRMYYCASPIVGSGHTFTHGGSGLFGGIAVQAWSGAHATPFDVENGDINNSVVTSIQTGSVTPNQNNSLIVSSMCPVSGTVHAINSSFTISDTNTTNEALAMAYLKQDTAAAVNPTWSWSGANGVAAVIAVFKPA